MKGVYKSFFTGSYQELMNQGQVLGYGMDQEWIHTAPVNTLYAWWLSPGSEALTALEDAFNAKMSGMDSTARAGMQAILNETTERNHQNGMTRLIPWRLK